MDKTDFTITRGIEKLEYKRGVRINDKPSSLVVTLVQNNKKGLFHLEQKVISNQITGEITEDKATLKALNDMSLQAIKDGMKWKKDWHEANKEKEDESQTEMFEDDESQNEGGGSASEMKMGFDPE